MAGSGWFFAVFGLTVAVSQSNGFSIFEPARQTIRTNIDFDAPTASAFVCNDDALYCFSSRSNVAILDLRTYLWRNSTFASIPKAGYQDIYFSLGKRVFNILIPSTIVGHDDLHPRLFLWNEPIAQFEELPIDPSWMPRNATRDVYFTIFTPDPEGTIAYFAVTSEGASRSEAIVVKMDAQVRHSDGVLTGVNVKRISQLTLGKWTSVIFMAVKNNSLHTFVRYRFTQGRSPEIYSLNFNVSYTVNLSSGTTSDVCQGRNDLVDPWERAYLIKDRLIAFGRTYRSMSEKGSRAVWSFDFTARQWSLTDFRFPYDSSDLCYTYDHKNERLYLRTPESIQVTSVYGLIVNSTLVQESEAVYTPLEGDQIVGRFKSAGQQTFVTEGGVLAQYNAWTSRWSFTNFAPIAKDNDGSISLHRRMGGHYFVISLPKSIVKSQNGTMPKLHFLDEAIGQFKELPLDVDRSWMPNLESENVFYDDYVPSHQEDSYSAYFATSCSARPRSETVVSKFEIQVVNGTPIGGRLKFIDRFELGADSRVQSLVVKDDVLYSLVQHAHSANGGVFSTDQKLDSSFAYTFDSKSNISGVITTQNDAVAGENWNPWNGAWVIKDQLVSFGFSRTGSMEGTNEMSPGIWSLNFATLQWRFIPFPFPTMDQIKDHYVDEKDKNIYLFIEDKGWFSAELSA